jgi:hypothetical protein
MSEQTHRLKGPLNNVEVVLDDSRKLIRTTINGRRVICRQTQFGLICEPEGGAPGAGGGAGPVLQLRVTPKRVFARTFAHTPDPQDLQARKGFKRHDF